MNVDWSRYPHLEEDHRHALVRMANALGGEAARDLLSNDPNTHVPRIEAFVRMEQMFSATAQNAFEQARARLQEEAEHQLGREAERLAAEREADRERLAEVAQHRFEAAEAAVAATVEAAVSAALRANAQHLQEQRVPAEPRREQRKPIKLDVQKYSGKESENLDHWILAASTAANALLIDDQRLRVAFALSHLKGRAQEWSYSKLLLNNEAFPDWDAFTQQLRAAFQPANSQLRTRARLLDCKQGKRTLHEFVQEMQFLRAALSADPIPESTLVTIFMKGLRVGPARNQLFRRVPPTLDEAIEVAQFEEYSFRSANGGPRGPEPMDLNGVQKFSDSKIRCFNCDRMGHRANNCRQPKRQQNRRDGKPSRGRGRPQSNKYSTKESSIPPKKGTTMVPPAENAGTR